MQRNKLLGTKGQQFSQSPKKLDVTIALVNYKTPKLLKNCLDSIYRFTKGVNFEIFTVDNGSGDESVEMVRKIFPGVKLIVNDKNLFATHGFNQILKLSQARFCLILSPDVEFLENTMFKMIKFLDHHKRVAAVSCRQINKEGVFDTTCSRFSTPIIEFYSASLFGKIFKNNKRLLFYRYDNWDRTDIKKVDVISDTIMLVRRDVLTKIDFYDEGMGLFFMENDLCLKMKKAGFSVYHLGTTTVLHHIGQSTIKFKPKQMYEFYERDMFYYYKKHFGFYWFLFLFIFFQSNRFYYLVEPLLAHFRNKSLVSK